MDHLKLFKYVKEKINVFIKDFKNNFDYKQVLFRIVILILISIITLNLLFNPIRTYCRIDNAQLNSQTTNVLLSEIKNEMIRSSIQIFLNIPFEYNNYDLIIKNMDPPSNNPTLKNNLWGTFLIDNNSYNIHYGKTLVIPDIPLQEEHNVSFSNFNINGNLGGDWTKITNEGDHMSLQSSNINKIQWGYEICIVKSERETINKLILIFLILFFIMPSVKSFYRFWIGSKNY